MHPLSQLKSASILPQVLKYNSSEPSGLPAKAEAFNQYFNSTFTHNNFVLPPLEALPTPQSQLNNLVFTSEEMYYLFNQLDCSKSPGCDDISGYILKGCSSNLYLYMTTLFASILETYSIPKDWKTHKIFPLYKKNNSCILCILNKVLESLLFKKIIDFMYPKLSESQFGFIKSRSTLSQLLISYSTIFDLIEKKRNADIICLDFAEAFDSIPHLEVLYKLWLTGITGSLWMLFNNYLINRTRYVEIEGTPKVGF